MVLSGASLRPSVFQEKRLLFDTAFSVPISDGSSRAYAGKMESRNMNISEKTSEFGTREEL